MKSVTRTELRELLPFMIHWANGGDLYWYSKEYDECYSIDEEYNFPVGEKLIIPKSKNKTLYYRWKKIEEDSVVITDRYYEEDATFSKEWTRIEPGKTFEEI